MKLKGKLKHTYIERFIIFFQFMIILLGVVIFLGYFNAQLNDTQQELQLQKSNYQLLVERDNLLREISQLKKARRISSAKPSQLQLSTTEVALQNQNPASVPKPGLQLNQRNQQQQNGKKQVQKELSWSGDVSNDSLLSLLPIVEPMLTDLSDSFLLPEDHLINDQAGFDAHNSQRKSTGNLYHVVVCTEPRVYQQWQVILAYESYLRVKSENPHSDMGGYTRILQGGQHDWLSPHIPTLAIQNLPDDISKGYVLLDRAFVLFIWSLTQHFENIKEKYILQYDPDMIFLKPHPNWATPQSIACHYQSYMNSQDRYHNLTRSSIDAAEFGHSGISPSIMHKDMLTKIAPLFLLYTMKVEAYNKVRKEFGWIGDMHAFILAAADLQHSPPPKFTYHQDFMVQTSSLDNVNKLTNHVYCPPNLVQGGVNKRCGRSAAFMFHYTYATPIGEDGQFCRKQNLSEVEFEQCAVHGFDKRQYRSKYPRQLEDLDALPFDLPELLPLMHTKLNKLIDGSLLYQEALAKGYDSSEHAIAEIDEGLAYQHALRESLSQEQRQIAVTVWQELFEGYEIEQLVV